MPSGYDFDLFVIGAGSGGVRASRIAASHGARVAVAEEHKVGGTCVIRGCVPKKLLVYGAQFAEDLEDAARYGWTIDNATFSWETLRDNVLAEVDRLNGLYTQTLANNKIETFLDRAVITGPNSVRVGEREITARYILIAVGARPHRPEFPGAELGITSNEAFHLDKLPEHIVIAGGGYIANEFAGVFHQLGSQVTIVNRSDQLLRGYDRPVVDRLTEISAARGIALRLNTRFTRAEKQADGRILIETDNGGPLICDTLLFATGRVPNVEGLGLNNAGVTQNEKSAISVDEHNQTSCPSIYAVGDVTDKVQLTPVAIREGQAFADNVFGNKASTVDYSCIPSAVFSHPPLAGVGLTEDEARKTLNAVKVYTSDFRSMKNGLANRNERALYRLIVDEENDRVVGVHLIGPDAPEILQMAAVAVKAGLTKAQFDACVAIHPTMAEELVLLK